MMQQEIELTVAETIKAPINPDAFYPRREAAKVLGLAEITLLRNERKEKLKAARAGRRVLYRGSELIRWLENSYEKKTIIRRRQSRS
jgi:hypothetical protein